MGCSLSLVESSLNLVGSDTHNPEGSSHSSSQQVDNPAKLQNLPSEKALHKTQFNSTNSSEISELYENPVHKTSEILKVKKLNSVESFFRNLETTKESERGNENKMSGRKENYENLDVKNHKMQLKDLTGLKFNQLFTFKKQLTKSQDAFYRDYVFLDPIGKGAGGEAFKVFHKPSNQYRVVKTVNSTDTSRIQKLNKRLADEANLIAKLDHPNIVKLYEVFEYGNKTTIVMEYVQGEDLYKNIKNPAFGNISAIATIIEQILSALVYLHGKGIIHKDLKLQNIVLEKADPFSNLKLIDFGFSEIQTKPETRNKAGTVIYMSPESLEDKHDTKCDIWATGVILYYLLFKEIPFNGDTSENIMQSIVKTDIDMLLKKKQNSGGKDILAINFLRRLLERNPEKRYSALEALSDPFILKYAQKPKAESSNIMLLRKFQQKTIMELVLPSIFVHHLMTIEEKAEYIRVFRALDRDRKGFVSCEDLKMIDNSLESTSKDQRQGLELTNFMIACVDTSDSHIQRRLFVYLDKNNDMLVQFKDVLQALSSYVSEDILKEITSFFENQQDYNLSYQDFKNMMKLI